MHLLWSDFINNGPGLKFINYVNESTETNSFWITPPFPMGFHFAYQSDQKGMLCVCQFPIWLLNILGPVNPRTLPRIFKYLGSSTIIVRLWLFCNWDTNLYLFWNKHSLLRVYINVVSVNNVFKEIWLVSTTS